MASEVELPVVGTGVDLVTSRFQARSGIPLAVS